MKILFTGGLGYIGSHTAVEVLNQGFDVFWDNFISLEGTGALQFKKIVLPIGISFFTFQAMSYVMDVYKGKANVQKNISRIIQQLGGSGKIHGCIIDIDFFNHIYVNPSNGTVRAYCAEDINGVVGPVHFESFTTTKPNPGPNPTVAFQDLTYDSSQSRIIGKVVANADAKMICYFTISANSGDIYNLCGLPYLTIPNGRYTYQAYLDKLKLNLIESSLSTASEEATII